MTLFDARSNFRGISPRRAHGRVWVVFCGLLVLIMPAIYAAEAQSNSPPATQAAASRLFTATERGDLAAVKARLATGDPVDARNDRGWTPLMTAAKAGNPEMVKFLIEKGADVNAKSTSVTGSTVLSFAAEGSNLVVLGELLAHGAKINAPSSSGSTPLYFAVANHLTAVAEALLSAGADIEAGGHTDATGAHYTPLIAAACSGDMAMVELLLAKGARIERASNNGDTALMAAAKYEHPDIVKLLIAKGANVKAAGPKGHTALIYAAYNGRLENMKLLLAAGADPMATATDSDVPGGPRYDAATLARQQNHPEALTLILDAQAKAVGANAWRKSGD